jgi:transposase-like protein
MKKDNHDALKFEVEAVKLITEQGLSVERAAKRRGIPRGSLGNWVTAVNEGSTLGQLAPNARSPTELLFSGSAHRKV